MRSAWPSRYRRLCRLSPRLYIGLPPAGVGAAFFPGTNVIAVDERLVDSWQPEAVACLLCHELLHFYLHTRGVRYTPPNETRYEVVAILEMGLSWRRLRSAGVLTDQASREIIELMKRNRGRRYWQSDGSRVDGAQQQPASAA